MDKNALNGMWDFMRQKYGMYLRVLDTIPADRFHDQPIADMRTPAQLVVHTSGNIVRTIAEGVASGTIETTEASEDDAAAALTSKDDVIAYARDAWAKADAAIATVGNEQLASPVENQWGIPLNGTFAMAVLGDEFLHHRGQLYAYARACGAEPPFMWSFEDNPEGFKPSAH